MQKNITVFATTDYKTVTNCKKMFKMINDIDFCSSSEIKLHQLNKADLSCSIHLATECRIALHQFSDLQLRLLGVGLESSVFRQQIVVIAGQVMVQLLQLVVVVLQSVQLSLHIDQLGGVCVTSCFIA